MKKLSFLLIGVLLLAGCQKMPSTPASQSNNTSPTTPENAPKMMLGFAQKTFEDKAKGFAFDYPEKAKVSPDCDPLSLQTKLEGETVYLLAPNNKDCTVSSDVTGLFFASRKVSSDAQMEKFFQDFAKDSDCKGIERAENPENPNVINITIKNIALDDPKQCDQMPNYRARWDINSEIMLIFSGKSSAPTLIIDPIDGDFEIIDSAGFLPSPTAPDPEVSLALEQQKQSNRLAAQVGNNIYCANEKVGTVKGERLYIKLYDQVVSFIPPQLTLAQPDIAKDLQCYFDLPMNGGKYVGFSYQDLVVSPKIHTPYGLYKTIETPEENAKITYKCDGSLNKKGDPTKGATTIDYNQNLPTFYCETNGKDTLSQFEFHAAFGFPVITTGGDVTETWHKIIIKKINNLNYFFMGETVVSYERDSYSVGDSEEKYNKVTQKTSLDRVLQDPTVTKSIVLWEKMVETFRVEPAGSII